MNYTDQDNTGVCLRSLILQVLPIGNGEIVIAGANSVLHQNLVFPLLQTPVISEEIYLKRSLHLNPWCIISTQHHDRKVLPP